MSDDKRRDLCTIDHSGKLAEARREDEQRFWLELARRRKAARERALPSGRPGRTSRGA